MPIKLSPARFAGRLATTFTVVSGAGLLTWATAVTSDTLTLDGTFKTVQLAGSDMVIELDPRGLAHITMLFDPEPTPTEFFEWRILTSTDNVNWDTVPWNCATIGFAEANPTSNLSVFIEGVRYFKVTCAVIDDDGSDGGTDVASTITVIVRAEEDT